MNGRRYLDSDGDGIPDVAPPPPAPAAVAPMGGRVGTSTDARNRAWRTFWPALGFDLLAALLLFVFPIVNSREFDFSTVEWTVLGVALAKTLVQTLVAFLMRRFKISPRTTTV